MHRSVAVPLHARLIIVGAITLGVMARASTFQSPLFDFHSWRQADTAAVSRNFLEERMNPLYPQVDFRGDKPVGYVETGFELHAFLVALVASVTGFSTHLGRVLSIASFPFCAWLIGAFVRERYGLQASVAAVVLYSIGLPLTMYVDRAFMNESLLALLVVVSLRSAQVHLRSGSARAFGALAASMGLIAIVKPTFLGVGAAVAGLFLEKYGLAGLWRWELWTVGAAAVSAGAAWFTHAHRLFELTGLTFGVTNKLFDAELLFSWAFVSKIGARIVKDLLSPVGTVAAIAGLVVALRTRRWAEPLGIAAFLLYLVVVTPGNFAHNYYQLPVVPIATVLMALGITEAIRVQGDRRSWSGDRRLAVLACVLWMAAVSTFVRNASFHSWYEVDQSRVRVCQDLTKALGPGQRVAFANYGSPDILFCVHRKGWLLGDDELTAARFTELLSTGAVIVTETRFAETVALLGTVGAPLVRTPEFVAYQAR